MWHRRLETKISSLLHLEYIS